MPSGWCLYSSSCLCLHKNRLQHKNKIQTTCHNFDVVVSRFLMVFCKSFASAFPYTVFCVSTSIDSCLKTCTVQNGTRISHPKPTCHRSHRLSLQKTIQKNKRTPGDRTHAILNKKNVNAMSDKQQSPQKNAVLKAYHLLHFLQRLLERALDEVFHANREDHHPRRRRQHPLRQSAQNAMAFEKSFYPKELGQSTLNRNNFCSRNFVIQHFTGCESTPRPRKYRFLLLKTDKTHAKGWLQLNPQPHKRIAP